MPQPDLHVVAPTGGFDGDTYDDSRDRVRLARQLDRVRYLLGDGQWWTLRDLARFADGSEASVSARIRDLRKPRFGGFTIDREYVSDGVWRYRMAAKDLAA